RAFSRSWRASQPQYARVSGIREQGFQQFRRSGPAILHRADRARDRAWVTVPQPLHPLLKITIQALSVKHERSTRKIRRRGRGLSSLCGTEFFAWRFAQQRRQIAQQDAVEQNGDD